MYHVHKLKDRAENHFTGIDKPILASLQTKNREVFESASIFAGKEPFEKAP